MVGALAAPAPPLDLAEEVAASGSISCKADTYYWGIFQSKHYCVQCPVGMISNACTTQDCHEMRASYTSPPLVTVAPPVGGGR